MELEFLKSLVIIFGVSAIVVFALGRLKMPSIVGFLIAGVILGPHGFGFIKDVHEVELLAEIGVILLMFTIGLEFSLKNLMMLRSYVFGGGIIQIALTVFAVAVMSLFCLNQRINAAIFDGFLVALSSTAIVIKLLMDRAEINSPHGRSSVGILIFQDLCVVPFMLLTPILAGNGGSLQDIAFTMLKSFGVLAAVLIGARWAVPFVLHEIVKTRSRELFIITIILLCIGTAFFTSKLGLSLALGAFLAGIVISESEYASQAIADIMPFKESFIGLFFISIGMLMDISFLKGNIVTVIGAVISIIVLKTIIAATASVLSGQPLRTSILSGFYLSQIGEFSFVLAIAGKNAGLLEEYGYQIFLSASVITMLLTPFIISISPRVSEYLIRVLPLRSFERIKRKRMREEFPSKRSEHVIIIGFGINGSNLAKVLKESGISYVVLEMNANTVKKMRKKGEPIYYGDGTSAEILHKMGIHKAKVLVVAISDAAATRRIVQIARQENRDIHIIVRTRYVIEVEDLLKLGANEVIPEEFETSIEIFSRVLHHYHVPRNVIAEHIDNIRKDSYSALRRVELPGRYLTERHEFLKDIETETYLIKEGSHISGHSIRELHLRAETGATIIAVQRGEEVHQNPPPDFVFKSGDVILLIGKRKDINNAIEYLESERFLVTRYHR
ncbi:sodium/hydrogen exchanger family/TrkA domain protein [Dissulfurispira thermophila]|uniref:Sodium/hydrogen exchanger family/TrkA domain protein n=2 Tax=root TaxID=1 RepID=A0A7G1GZT5_9BACT|nr:monovalent cation:proton antiporter-2 (CPA2) family protein [Dissulfurispira thermophila]BCB95443.1 sodium/hydrogen exchanger family/TrkA domain protein [Dissulfurispira thermophila]